MLYFDFCFQVEKHHTVNGVTLHVQKALPKDADGNQRQGGGQGGNFNRGGPGGNFRSKKLIIHEIFLQ